MVYLPIHRLKGTLAIVSKATINIHVHVFYGHVFNLLGKFQGIQLSYGTVSVIKTDQTLPSKVSVSFLFF